MPRVLLVIPTASYRASDFVRAAADLGVSVVIVSDADLALTGARLERSIVVEFGRGAVDTIVRELGDLVVDAVIGVDDGAVVLAADVAEALGVPHASPEAVAATRDKLVMRRMLADAGVAQPAFAAASTAADAAVAAAGLGYPVVVKPVSLSASRGVIRADDEPSLLEAFARARSIDVSAGSAGDRPLLIEAYVDGAEVAVEAVVVAAEVEVLAVFDKPDPLVGPFFEETIFITPSERADEVIGVVSAGVEALGIESGPVHAEVRIGEGGPVLIEIAARSIGGLCSRALTFGLLQGSLEEQILRASLGLSRRGMSRTSKASGVMMLPTPSEGVLEGVFHAEAVAEVDGITAIEITVTTGRWVRPLPEGDRYLGFLFAEGETPADVEAALREAHGLLEVRIDPTGTPSGRVDVC